MVKKKKSKNKKPSERWKKYKLDGGKIVRSPSCPKCGSFLGLHKDRNYCGSCHYVEFKKVEK